MRRDSRVWYFAMMAVILSAPAAAQHARQVDAIVEEWVTPNGPGCSVAIDREGSPRLSRSYGIADLERHAPITEASRFDVGSVGKQFTAAALILLAQDGRLSLSDDVRKYVPEMPEYGRVITLEHLLTHTSGLRDVNVLNLFQGWEPQHRRQFAQQEQIRLATRQASLNFTPGQMWSYSNTGYILAAEVVERVSGKSLKEFLRDRIFEPLGMRATEVRDDYRTIIPDRVHGYSIEDGRALEAPPTSVYGAGNVVSTPQDLLIWRDALARARLGSYLSTEMVREAEAPNGRRLGYARGLFIRSHKGQAEVSHDGGTPGGTAILLSYPAQNLAVAVACNGNHPAPTIGRRIADVILPDQEVRSAPAPGGGQTGAHPPELRGTYFDGLRALRATVTLVDGRLRWNGTPLEMQSRTQFLAPRFAISIINRNTIRYVSSETGEERVFTRIDGPLPTGDQLAALAGLYRSSEIDTAYRAVIRNGKLVLDLVDGPVLDWPLDPIGPDLFDAYGNLVSFTRNNAGAIDGLRFHNSRVRELRFDRVGGEQ